jgi:hypothetical protein
MMNEARMEEIIKAADKAAQRCDPQYSETVFNRAVDLMAEGEGRVEGQLMEAVSHPSIVYNITVNSKGNAQEIMDEIARHIRMSG